MAVFLSNLPPKAKAKTKPQIKWSIASVALHDAYTDFILSRQAMNCAPATLQFYGNTAGVFLAWCDGQGITQPQEVTARIVRQYLAGLEGKADRTRHAHARAIKTLLRFWHAEKYIPEIIKFEMPKIAKKRLPRLTAEQLQAVLKVCNVRDKAIVLFMADSGLRRSEVIALTWADVDMQSGAVTVRRGKGGKARMSRIGATTRRALLAYRRTISNAGNNSALFQTTTGARLMEDGLQQLYRRLSKRTGFRITAHAMRRTWTLLSLRAGMDAIHLQILGGWAGLDMVAHYASLEDDDLLQAHRDHSPIDNL